MPNIRRTLASLLLLAPLVLSAARPAQAQIIDGTYDRDPKQPIDEAYSAKIKQYTTGPTFISPLVDHLPASKTVPTPMKVLGDVAGAPDMLPYAEDVYKYFRLLESSTPRVKVTTIGHSEEGREMIAAMIADESLLKQQAENDTRLAKLGDPRTINFDDAQAKKLAEDSFPIYYITGTIHSSETGAPTALMELAYRLAVDDSPYIKYIRSHMIVMITPVVEVDGRDRMVDIYKWHKANPGKQVPRLTYWGHYVAHDNNRDGMGMTLNLTRNVLDQYLGTHATVLHDLHESVAFLYDNTIGDGPYNAWIDPMLADEWAEIGWNNMAQMQALNMPGVFTHGTFDTWSPGYLMFMAAMHNGISRLYETFGNGGADTEKRTLTAEETSRTWYRPNPPLPVVTWSQRDNNNYEESALLTTLNYFAHNTHHFLDNYYVKSKRAIQKPTVEGPSAYVLPADSAELNRQIQLMISLKHQHVEISRLTADTTVKVPAVPRSESPAPRGDGPARGGAPSGDAAPPREVPATDQLLPAGSFVIRMDQPYSRAADALLDRQYWAPDDPQKRPYDDTGWCFSELFNLKVLRLKDPAILSAKMDLVTDPTTYSGTVTGSGSIIAVANNGQNTLLPLLYTLKSATAVVAEKPFDAAGKHFLPGALLITNADDATLTPALKKLSLDATRLDAMPSVATHPAAAPRIAIMHTWLGTQTEGWWRYAFDNAGVPFTYISTQTAAAEPDLKSKYDVIVFAPVGRASSSDILNGSPKYANPLPWLKTDLTPNLTALDSTPDQRIGLGYDGLAHLQSFIEKGGLFITSEDTAQFAIEMGLAPGVSVAPRGGDTRVVGSVLDTVFVSQTSPIAYGYGKSLPVFSSDGMAFAVSNTVGRGGGGGGRGAGGGEASRPTGRGGVDDPDVVQGRINDPAAPAAGRSRPWEARAITEEQMRTNAASVIPKDQRPEVILRFTDARGLLLSGLLAGGATIAERPVVVDAHLGKGNVLLFATYPMYRGETIGSYPLVFNAIMNYQNLTTTK
jgi:hypothetical protein